MSGPAAVLVGPMGAGKSTVGRLLADLWTTSFRDTDADIETAEQRTIADLFVDEGEAYFRAVEHAAVVTALAEHQGVLALGGGTVLEPRTRRLLEDHQVVFLDVGLAEATKRVGLGQGRPLLLGNVRAQMKQMLAERHPVYAGVADLVVETSQRSAAEVADYIDQHLDRPPDPRRTQQVARRATPTPPEEAAR